MQGMTSGERIMTSRRVYFWDCLGLLIKIRWSKLNNCANCNHWLQKKISFRYVEINCQLDATEVFIADFIACSTCFGHH